MAFLISAFGNHSQHWNEKNISEQLKNCRQNSDFIYFFFSTNIYKIAVRTAKKGQKHRANIFYAILHL